MKTNCIRIAASLVLATSAHLAMAADTDVEQLRATTLKLIDLLVQQGVLTRDKADALLKEAQKTDAPKTAVAPAAAASGPASVRVPYVPEFVRKEIKDEVRSELAAQAEREGWAGPGTVPEWARRLTFEGDLRVRAEADRYADENAPAISVTDTNRNRAVSPLNTTEDRNRLRVRARLGVTAALDDNWSGGLRLTTGSVADPVSSNQTLGNYNNRFVVAFDRAYLRYRYGEVANVVAGRFGNPWFGTDLVWANDLSFDGVAAQWTPKLASNARGFLTVAAMPIQEVELGTDKWLFGAQVGATIPSTPRSIGGKLGLAYYRYKNIVGQASPVGSSVNEYTAPQFVQKGNTYYNISSDVARPLLGLAADYRLMNLTGSLDIPVSGRYVFITGDYVRNLGYDASAVSTRVGGNVEPMTTGYQARVAFGSAEVKARGDWQAFVGYKRVERDAVLDAFTDSDFHLGGTDARGFFLGGSYGIGKNNALGLRVFSAESISGPPLAIDVWQIDLNVRF